MSTKRTKPSNPAKISIASISSFVQGYARSFSKTFGLLADYKQEQVVWRSQNAKECLENGSCVYCGCTTPAKFYSDEACEDPERLCYPSMMSKEEWEMFKKGNNLTIKIDQDEPRNSGITDPDGPGKNRL